MAAENSIEPKKSPPTTSEADRKLLKRWILDQLTILAEALGETLSERRQQIYIADLARYPKTCWSWYFSERDEN